MSLDPRHCAALIAVIESGSFEQAAAQLHLTPSAVSQRVRALEEALGKPLVIRTRPCRATPDGQRLLRHLRMARLLEQELEAEFEGDDAAPLTVALAVNADSLASWVLPALVPFARQENILLDLTVEDQNHTFALLEAGKVSGCISTQAKAMRGCAAEALGTMRYRAMAAPEFKAQWFAGGMTQAAARRAPALFYNCKDDL
ncbi:MAG TPA: ArgP/LysG family DNA-binding transcriptional regulator, partial [Burkholderiaceae bacterium]